MSAQIIDGRAIAQGIKTEVARAASQLQRSPGLAVIRVGNDPASEVYVKSKDKTARELGFRSWHYHLEASVTQENLLALVHRLNGLDEVDAILVQLPLPAHLDTAAVLDTIAPEKDVDGFHPLNAGRLFEGRPLLVPCTPLAVMRLLQEVGFNPKGKRCVVVGRSTIVGRPMAALLLNASATVTCCHSKSDVKAETERADLVVAAVGQRGLIRGDWVAPGAVVIDVGMNRGPTGELTGDVAFDEVKERAAYLTPVPGGVGPMTIAMLMHNTLLIAARRQSRT